MDAIEERILEVAKSFIADKSWPWLEPVRIESMLRSGEKAWRVRTNIRCRGRNVRLLIRESDFAVIESGYMPR